MPFDNFTPFPLIAFAVFGNVPIASGVFGISNAEHWILIEETEDLRGALLKLLGQAGHPAMAHQPTTFVFETCESLARSERVDRLVFEYEPALNRWQPLAAELV